MTWRWPWCSRGRLDDAQARVAELSAKVAELEEERNRLVDTILVLFGARPIFHIESAGALPAPSPAPPSDGVQAEMSSPAGKAVKDGARNARAICGDVERILNRRFNRMGGRVRPEQAEVARQLEETLRAAEAVGTAAGNGNNGNGTH